MLSIEQAQKLNTRYAGRAISFVEKGQYRGASNGYLLVVSESGFIYYDEDWCREFFTPWEKFDRFTNISEAKSLKHKRYNKDSQGKFAKEV
jgi:hypothetical protein